jgi:hypothetical protein
VEELQNIKGKHQKDLPAVGTELLFLYNIIGDERMKVEKNSVTVLYKL